MLVWRMLVAARSPTLLTTMPIEQCPPRPPCSAARSPTVLVSKDGQNHVNASNDGVPLVMRTGAMHPGGRNQMPASECGGGGGRGAGGLEGGWAGGVLRGTAASGGLDGACAPACGLLLLLAVVTAAAVVAALVTLPLPVCCPPRCAEDSGGVRANVGYANQLDGMPHVPHLLPGQDVDGGSEGELEVSARWS